MPKWLNNLSITSLLAIFVLGGTALSAMAQNSVELTINHNRIVAGEPLLITYLVKGVTDNAFVAYKDLDKGWVSVRLIDDDGKEVGTFAGDERHVPSSPSLFDIAKRAEVEASNDESTEKADDSGVKYLVPKMTIDRRIIVPQTTAITKAGTYRLLVRVRMLAASKKPVSPSASQEELNALEPRKYRVIKASKIFKIVVTSADPAALEQKAAELRDTFITAKGSDVLEAAHELLALPPALAEKEFHVIAGDPRSSVSQPISKLNTLSKMLAFESSPLAVKFLGELTWEMNKLDARPLLYNSYRSSNDAALKKQIAGLFAVHGEDIAKSATGDDD